MLTLFLEGTPILGHHSVVSPKMNIPISHMTPFFIAESFSNIKMEMFKKTELNTLRVNQDKGVLRLKEKTFAKVLILFFKRKT